MKSFALSIRLLAFLLVVAQLTGCPPRPPHEHPELLGEWQRRSPEDPHQWEAEQIHFESETEVYYFGGFGGPNTLMDAKQDENFPEYPAFRGTYAVDETVEPHAINFTWTHY